MTTRWGEERGLTAKALFIDACILYITARMECGPCDQVAKDRDADSGEGGGFVRGRRGETGFTQIEKLKTWRVRRPPMYHVSALHKGNI
jgi:hypothetical protein